MRQFLPILGLALTLALPAAHAQTPAWTGAVQPTNPTPTDDTGAVGLGLTIDAGGNQYVAGLMQNGGGSGAPATRIFGSTTLTGGTGYGNGFVAKLSPSQQWLWALKATNNGDGAIFQQVTTSPAGDTYAAGIVNDDASIYPNGGTTLTVGSFTYTTTKYFASFITRLNASGQPQWLAGVSGTEIYATGWDASAGNLVVAGEYYGTVAFGATTLPAAPLGGIFVARLSASGQWLSAVGAPAVGSTGEFLVYSCAVGPQGQVGVNVRLSGGQLVLGSTTVASAGNNDRKATVAQLSPAGQWQWATTAATANAFFSNAMQYDRTGNLWLLGDAGSSPVQLGTTTIPNGEEFVGRLSPAGQWNGVGIIGYSAGGSAGYSPSLTVDGRGNAVIAGILNRSTSYTFAPFTLSVPSTVVNGLNYVARFNPATAAWDFAQFAPTPSGGDGYYFGPVALDANGSLVTAGTLRGGSVTFGTTAITVPSTTGSNVFVAKLANAGLPTAVRQPAGLAPLALYPNPAAAGTAPTLRLPEPASAAQPLTLHDALGRAVRQGTIPAGQQEVSLPTLGLTPGLYMIQAGLRRAQLVVE